MANAGVVSTAQNTRKQSNPRSIQIQAQRCPYEIKFIPMLCTSSTASSQVLGNLERPLCGKSGLGSKEPAPRISWSNFLAPKCHRLHVGSGFGTPSHAACRTLCRPTVNQVQAGIKLSHLTLASPRTAVHCTLRPRPTFICRAGL